MSLSEIIRAWFLKPVMEKLEENMGVLEDKINTLDASIDQSKTDLLAEIAEIKQAIINAGNPPQAVLDKLDAMTLKVQGLGSDIKNIIP